MLNCENNEVRSITGSLSSDDAVGEGPNPDARPGSPMSAYSVLKVILPNGGTKPPELDAREVGPASNDTSGLRSIRDWLCTGRGGLVILVIDEVVIIVPVLNVEA